MTRTQKSQTSEIRQVLYCLVLLCSMSAIAQTNLSSSSRLEDLSALSAESLDRQDIALVNLLTAQAVPIGEVTNIQSCLETLDEWTQLVRSATARNLYRFKLAPQEFENSEAYFRMLVLVTVLQQDLGVHYDTDRIGEPKNLNAGSAKFFKDGRGLFIHGLLTERRMGTCASMPVLYISIGRRLGYPLKLVSAKAHLFVRWESTDGHERLNIEASSRGLVTHPDAYYQTWPSPIADKEIASGQYLKSLTPAEEFAEFLVLRACCLMSNGRTNEAKESLGCAARLAPDCERYKGTLVELTRLN